MRRCNVEAVENGYIIYLYTMEGKDNKSRTYVAKNTPEVASLIAEAFGKNSKTTAVAELNAINLAASHNKKLLVLGCPHCKRELEPFRDHIDKDRMLWCSKCQKVYDSETGKFLNIAI